MRLLRQLLPDPILPPQTNSPLDDLSLDSWIAISQPAASTEQVVTKQSFGGKVAQFGLSFFRRQQSTHNTRNPVVLASSNRTPVSLPVTTHREHSIGEVSGGVDLTNPAPARALMNSPIDSAHSVVLVSPPDTEEKKISAIAPECRRARCGASTIDSPQTIVAMEMPEPTSPFYRDTYLGEDTSDGESSGSADTTHSAVSPRVRVKFNIDSESSGDEDWPTPAEHQQDNRPPAGRTAPVMATRRYNSTATQNDHSMVFKYEQDSDGIVSLADPGSFSPPQRSGLKDLLPRSQTHQGLLPFVSPLYRVSSCPVFRVHGASSRVTSPNRDTPVHPFGYAFSYPKGHEARGVAPAATLNRQDANARVSSWQLPPWMD